MNTQGVDERAACQQAYRLVLELVRRNRVRMATAAGTVPVRQVSISREVGKPTLVMYLLGRSCYGSPLQQKGLGG